MTNGELFSVIFKRKSVRRYDMTPLGQDKLVQLENFMKSVKGLDDSIKIEFSIQSVNEVSSIFAVKAPHYLSFYSEKKDGYLINAGFIMQQIDLYLSANKLGSCWLGVAKPNKGVPGGGNGFEHVVMLAFGNPAEPVHRTSIEQFKRNKLSEISSIKGAEQLLEPVRLAPSAANTQVWYFSGNIQEIIVSRKKLSVIKAQLYGRMNIIDIGIALCHLWLSADNQGKSAEFDLSGGIAPGGYEYMARVSLRDL